MKARRMLLAVIAVLALSVSHWMVACGPGATTKEPGQETTPNQEGQKEAVTNPEEGSTQQEPASESTTDSPADGSTGTEPSPESTPEPTLENPPADGGSEQTPTEQPPTEQVQEQPSSSITMSFNPKSGSQIDAKDVCITITFSGAVNKADWQATWQAKGASKSSIVVLNFSSATEAKACFNEYLEQNTQFTLTVKVKDANSGGLITGSADYTTKAPYASGKTGSSGLTVDLQLDKVLVPAALNSLIGSVNPDQILPVLMHLHSRDSGSSGSVTFVGGVGTTPSGKPHRGKDVFENKNQPVAIVLKGSFSGSLFTAGPSTFRLSVGGFNLVLEQFRLSGLFNAAGTNFQEVRFSGILDSNSLKSAVGIDPCLLLPGECFQRNGRTVLFMVGLMKSILNPVKFSALITAPVFLTTGTTLTPTLDFYFTEEADPKNVSFAFSSCTNAGSNDKPCDPNNGAVLTSVTVQGNLKVNAGNKSGTYEVTSGLSATTWYKAEITAKDKAGNVTYKTHTVFRTQ